MKSLGNKGFVLVETLIVSLFIMGIFTFIYTNLFPLIGEYERRENYDDISTKYTAHHYRMMILQDENYHSITDLNGAPYKDLTGSCSLFKNVTYCEAFKNHFGITRVYLAEYDLTTFKNTIKNTALIGEQSTYGNFQKYVEYLPTYQKDPKNDYLHLIIETKEGNYSIIEVQK